MGNFKKTMGMLSTITALFFVWSYGQISAFPAELTLLRGQSHSLPAFVAPSFSEGDFLWEKNDGFTRLTPEETGSFSMDFSTLGFLKKKTTVHVVEPKEVVLGGEVVGIKMYMQGVLVVGLSQIPNTDRSPGKEAGILAGDRILSVEGEPLSGSTALEKAVENSGGNPITLLVCRGEKQWETTISPVYYQDAGLYKIGLWVRESTAGIGTLTFSLPQSGAYGALGHSIADPDTGMVVSTARGSITACQVGYIAKGEDGAPGAIHGVFREDMGSISKNADCGLYGVLSVPKTEKTVPIAVSTQVEKGEAMLCSNIAGGKPRMYTVEIEKILHRKNPGAKSMVIRITDPRLLRLSGGIIQGMSGSPLVQNGKLIGAVTHVFVNDPTRGYGIFIENMLSEAEKIK